MNLNNDDKKKAVNFYSFAIEMLEDTIQMLNDDSEHREEAKDIVPYNLQLIRGSLRCIEDLVTDSLSSEEDANKLTVDKESFMSAMKNLAEFLDAVCWDIAAGEVDWPSESVHDWLNPIAKDLETASGIQLESGWVKIPDD